MRVGVPREIKADEYRVALTPAGANELVRAGHEVWVEHAAGLGASIRDEAYERVGAQIGDAEAAWGCELVLKVKEPQPAEFRLLREGQILFTYLHLAPDPAQCSDLMASGAVCIAYETVTHPQGGLPLLAPMSEVAGRMSVQAGAHHLEKAQGGMG